MDTSITLGIENFRFALMHKCIREHDKTTHICLSLKLMGNFLPAAWSDDISDTVDYEALCHHIEKACEKSNCTSFEDLTQLQNVIVGFSPLITGGYLSFTVECHDTFTIGLTLDMNQSGI